MNHPDTATEAVAKAIQEVAHTRDFRVMAEAALAQITRDASERVGQRYARLHQMLRDELQAQAWDAGALAGWKQSGEGWNAEYPDESTGGCSVDLTANPYRPTNAV